MDWLLETPADYVAIIDGRRCSKCGEVKPIEEFAIKNKKTGLRRTWCRDCARAYGREHYRKNKPTYLAKNARRRKLDRPRMAKLLDDYLRSRACVDCGATDVLLLDFDHRDRSIKRGLVSRIARSGNWAAVEREIEKCDVRCGNCHRKRTAEQLRWRKAPERGALAEVEIAQLGPSLTRPSSTGRAVIDQLLIWEVGTLKRCYLCGEVKPVAEFAMRDRRTRERQGHCRSCQAIYRRDHYQRNRGSYIERALAQVHQRREEHVRRLHDYLTLHPCVDCGESDIRVLEFDHVDGEKEMAISNMLGRRSWARIVEEIGKCDVRCVNCHRKRTAERAGWRISEVAGFYVGRVRLISFAGVA